MNANRMDKQSYLTQDQYSNASKLAKRIALHAQFSTHSQDIWDWYFEQVLREAPKTAKVLEIGSGRGDMWRTNAARVPENWDITLTDLSEGMLEDNKQHIGDFAARVRYEVCDAQAIPYPDNSFDILFANWMLYHVPDITKALREFRRVLKPDGLLFASTNGEQHMAEIFRIADALDEIENWATFFTHNFGLRGGFALLMDVFSDIHMIEFQADLWVTAAQPILDYIESMIRMDGENIIKAHGEKIRADLESRIAADGGILIQKETGLFVCRGDKLSRR